MGSQTYTQTEVDDMVKQAVVDDRIATLENILSICSTSDSLGSLKSLINMMLGGLQQTRPRIVCLCGSTRFKEAFQKAQLEETLALRIVLTVGSYTVSDDELFAGWPEDKVRQKKAELDKLHKHKIDLADELLVLNVGGYIGSSTASEIEYARRKGKPIRYLEGIGAG